MKILVIISVNLCVILFIIYYIRNVKDYKEAELAKKNIIVKKLFDEIERHDFVDFSEITIEREGLSMKSLYYSNKRMEYSFLNNGGLLRNKALPRLIAILLIQKYQFLSNSSLYSFEKYRIYREDGEMDYGYRFVLKPKQRDLIYKLRKISKA